ncbi:hypothetical protein M2447_001206 [Ereboglobus sp. PH5-10]|uniref:hypothetical protein n=1 Tax=Ereboglobus sp. PH5-10 TaxID=2940629 RepID=UPI0024067A3C|nr:hypothetical protein [Ereboglobus sp. PH5-10]MDF9827117.1 hypothetical protein [Ereboglobus sp. PH5-10]
MSIETKTPIDTAVIVHEKPPSGAFDEILFGHDHGNTLWVLFSDKDGILEWIGKFACGFSSSMRVIKLVEPDRFLIVAGGNAYLIDASRRMLMNQYSGIFGEEIAYDPERNHFIAADVCLRIIENGQEIWTSKRIALDAIYNMKIEGRILSGMAVVDYNGDENNEEQFAFNLDSREFIYGPDLSVWDTPSAQAKPKPWWKFW